MYNPFFGFFHLLHFHFFIFIFTSNFIFIFFKLYFLLGISVYLYKFDYWLFLYICWIRSWHLSSHRFRAQVEKRKKQLFFLRVGVGQSEMRKLWGFRGSAYIKAKAFESCRWSSGLGEQLTRSDEFITWYRRIRVPTFWTHPCTVSWL